MKSMKKVTLVLGAAAIALFASQALVLGEADAHTYADGKHCIKHDDGGRVSANTVNHPGSIHDHLDNHADDEYLHPGKCTKADRDSYK
jgi:hypothetical protein